MFATAPVVTAGCVAAVRGAAFLRSAVADAVHVVRRRPPATRLWRPVPLILLQVSNLKLVHCTRIAQPLCRVLPPACGSGAPRARTRGAGWYFVAKSDVAKSDGFTSVGTLRT